MAAARCMRVSSPEQGVQASTWAWTAFFCTGVASPSMIAAMDLCAWWQRSSWTALSSRAYVFAKPWRTEEERLDSGLGSVEHLRDFLVAAAVHLAQEQREVLSCGQDGERLHVNRTLSLKGGALWVLSGIGGVVVRQFCGRGTAAVLSGGVHAGPRCVR